MTFITPEGSPRPRVGVKPPPMEAVGGCPARPDATDDKAGTPMTARLSNDALFLRTGHLCAVGLPGAAGRDQWQR
jgi:hypothetical protein